MHRPRKRWTGLGSVVVVAPPDLSRKQRSDASAKAVANRRRRAQVKEQLRSGELSWNGLLELARADDVVASLRVSDALSCLPGVGPSRLDRFMSAAHISPTRRLRGLGQHQIATLNGVLAR